MSDAVEMEVLTPETVELEVQDVTVNVGGTTNHAELTNLDYASSGHTGFQASISDLSTIRSGASAGATAYQKPATGIPSSDMASAVQTSLGKADTALQEHQSLSAYRTSADQDVIDATKATKRTVKSTMDAVATVNTDYFLGTQSSVSITLPSSPSVGDMISVVFYSGSTATSLSVSGSTIGTVPTPSTNQRIEMNMVYDGTYWAVLSNTMTVS